MMEGSAPPGSVAWLNRVGSTKMHSRCAASRKDGEEVSTPISDEADPLRALFGVPTRALWDARAFALSHGPIERFPAWMRSGPLENVRALSSEYKGALEVAQGRTSAPVPGQEFVGRGGQVRVQGPRADALLQLGLTVFFVDITTAVPESVAFLRDLEAVLGVPRCSSAGVFANAPGSGLPWHHDSHDQLLIQLSGKKTFAYVAERSVEFPGLPFSPSSIVHPDFAAVYAEGFVDSAEAIERLGPITVTLEPGSCLFLPAGTFHRTVDQPEAALSLAIAVRPPSRLDLLLTALRHGALASPRFRASAYGQFPASNEDAVRGDEPAFSADELAFLTRNLARLTRHDLKGAWLARERARDGIGSDDGERRHRFTRYLRVPSTELDWEPVRGELVTCVVRPVEAALPSRLGFAAVARPIVDHVLSSTRAFSAQDVCERFQEFEEDEVFDLLDQLVRVRLLCPVPFAGFRDA